MVSRFFPVPFGKWMIIIDVLEHLVIAVHLREEKYQIGNNNSEIDLVLATITWAIRHFDILFWIPLTSLSNKKSSKRLVDGHWVSLDLVLVLQRKPFAFELFFCHKCMFFYEDLDLVHVWNSTHCFWLTCQNPIVHTELYAFLNLCLCLKRSPKR